MPTEMQSETKTETKTEAQLVTFKLDEQVYALDIGRVVQVVRMVALTRPPKAPEYVEGMINLKGKVIPVIDVRKRCGLPVKPHDLDTQLLIARANGHTVALTVDVVSEVLTLPTSNIQSSEEVGQQLEHLSAVGKWGDRLILILDPDMFLPDDAQDLLPKVTRE
jgi:purine-binding chemotaxis protein CheW